MSSQNIQIEKLNIHNGLPDNSVRDVIQDQKGYLWFGTLNGLSKYDGNTFKNYYSIPKDPTSLCNNRMVKIREDKKGFIWSWSDDFNVQRINPITDKVININKLFFKNKILINEFRIASNGAIWIWGNQSYYKIEYLENDVDLKITTFNTQNGLGNSTIHFLEEDNQGHIWVGTETGLIKIDAYKKDNPCKTYYKNTKFTCFNTLKNNIWFGTHLGLIYRYSLETNQFKTFDKLNTALKNNSILNINQVNSKTLLISSNTHIFEFNIEKNITTSFYNDDFIGINKFFNDSFNNTWIIFEKTRGIYKYDPQKKKIDYYSLNAEKRGFLGDLDKHQILEDSNKNLWIGIHGGGLFLYDRAKNKFINYKSDEEKTDSLSSDIVLNIFEDTSKNIWVSTMHGGVNKIKLSKENFIWHQPDKTPGNIYENEIRAVAKDKKGNLWLGSKGGKIFCYKNNELRYTFPNNLSRENKLKLKNVSVYSLYLDHDNNLWVGTKGKGIFVIKNITNTPKNKLEIVSIDIKELHSLRKIYAITQDKNKNYWIGSHGNGLGMISDPFHNPKIEIFDDILSSKYIRYLFFDQDDNLWIATSNGVDLLTREANTSNKTFISIKNKKEKGTSLSYNAVDHIFQTQDKSIYISTMGGGLNILYYTNLQNRVFEFKHIDKSDGLSSNKILAAQEDSNNNIWISTNLGINKYYPKNDTFEDFFIKRKNGLNYFTEGCVSKLSNGDFLFGNHKGFMTFNPEQIIKDTTAYPIVLSKFFVNGNEELPKTSTLINKNIEFVNEVKLSYQQNTIRFNFSVLDFKTPEQIQYSYKLDNFDTHWSTPLTNNTAIYQNLPHGNYTFLLKATNSDGVQLPKILKFKVSITPPFYKSNLGYFIEFLIFCLVLFSFLYLYKKQIYAKQEVIYANKFNEKKLIYYTNISHEFKTPLTLISCQLQDIINDENITVEKVKSITKKIQKSSSYLSNLVEQILDFRKIREEKMKLFLRHTNIVYFLKNIYSQFIPLATKEGIDLSFHSQNDNLYGYIDINIVTKIIYNLLSNAFKFTPTKKAITVSIRLDQISQCIQIEIKDEGKGISVENQKKLFERFSKSENSSGLGLFYVKELIDCHKGTIKVNSTLNIGTRFTIAIPIDKNYYDKDDLEVNTIPVIENNLYESKLTSQLYDTEIDATIDPVKNHTSSMLIIDDNDDIRTYLSHKFRSFFNVFTAKNGKEGLELAIKEIPNIVICDLMMPIMDGIETIKALRENFNTCHIPIILLTVNSSEHKKIEGIKIGADYYINKPFDIEHLKLKIDALISQRKKIVESFSKNPELSMAILTKTEEHKIFIQKVKKVVEESMGKSNFSIDSTATKLGLSRTNFYKKIKEITNETPNKFISIVQMKKAALLLKDTNYPTSEISVICGFNDIRYFSKIFKKYFGMPPKEYQTKYKNSIPQG